MALITPRTPAGVMELLPRQQIAFQRMLDTIRRGFERYGFLPIETPVFETVDVLLTKSGGETEKQIYFVQSTGARQQGREPDMALRFDLTVPLARYVAEHERGLVFPFRRYQMQRVYRGERAQKGRYREFTQCDIDVIGKDTLPLLYDAEMPAVINQVFGDLAFGDFTINLNNRKLLAGLLAGLGVDGAEPQRLALREIDKLDKLDREAVARNLVAADVGLDVAGAERLLGRLDHQAGNADILADLAALGIDNAPFRTGLDELGQVVAGVAALGVPEERLRINLAIARGLDYYTGTVYETLLNANPGLGSVCSGGRYDDLASQYTRSRLPGVGLSIGATRLFSQLLDAGLVGAEDRPDTVLVTQFDDTMTEDTLRVAAGLRAEGLTVEVQFSPGKIARQLKYADRAGIRFAVLRGEVEVARSTALIKRMDTGAQEEVPLPGLAARLKQMMG